LLGRTDWYAVIMWLLKARTPAARAVQLRRVVADRFKGVQ
jgi:hypothetical protein